MEYRRHEQPGCGGCFLLIILLIFITGGAPLLFEFLGLIVFGFLFLLFSGIAAFWAFTYYMKRQVSAYEKSQTEDHNTFVFLLINILVKVAHEYWYEENFKNENYADNPGQALLSRPAPLLNLNQ